MRRAVFALLLAAPTAAAVLLLAPAGPVPCEARRPAPPACCCGPGCDCVRGCSDCGHPACPASDVR